MVYIPQESTKQKMLRDGSVSKFLVGAVGAGIGMIAGGAVLAAAGLLLTAAMMGVLEPGPAVVAGLLFDAPGFLLIIVGIYLKNRRLKNYKKIVSKRSGLPEEDVDRADEEFKDPGTILLTFEKKLRNKEIKKAGFITEHYVRFPGIIPQIFRIEDLAACFYTKKFQFGDGGYGRALIAYGTNKDGVYDEAHTGYRAMLEDEDVGQEIVKAVASKNPTVITGHFFTFAGKKYDAVKNVDEVIALHQRMCRQQNKPQTDGESITTVNQ